MTGAPLYDEIGLGYTTTRQADPRIERMIHDALSDAQRVDEVASHLGAQTALPVPIPADCHDGFMPAFWARPHAYLDPRVRAGISVFARLDPAEVETTIARLRADLDSGAWSERNAELAGLEELISASGCWSRTTRATTRSTADSTRETHGPRRG